MSVVDAKTRLDLVRRHAKGEGYSATAMAIADNESIWKRNRLTREYEKRGRGEQLGVGLFCAELAVLGELWHELSGKRILDLGVGGGRTIPYLLVLSDQYVALDYSPGMVRKARQLFPHADIRQGDARNLAFPDASFDFVLFSFNGIDMVPFEDRGTVLQEVYRVLRRGGYFAFSTHNLNHLDGEMQGVYRRPPLDLARNPLRTGVRIARWGDQSIRGYLNYRRLRSGEESGDGYAILNDGVHDYALLTCYVDPRMQCKELERSGFAHPPRIFGRDGRPTTVDSTDKWLLFLVAKPVDSD